MTITEAAVTLFGLFAGYWVVSKLFFRTPAAKDQPQPGPSRAPAANRPAIWHEILAVSPSASSMEVREAYKHLISKYHPDKVENLGQELKDLAELKTQEITRAYRDAMRALGEDP
jgi:DnaJ-domain-containing protein 1